MNLMTRLVLTRPHTHAGKQYGAGDRIDVDADIAEWLLSLGTATREPPPPKTDSESKPFQRKEPKQ